jgi:hypothetical protein
MIFLVAMPMVDRTAPDLQGVVMEGIARVRTVGVSCRIPRCVTKLASRSGMVTKGGNGGVPGHQLAGVTCVAVLQPVLHPLPQTVTELSRCNGLKSSKKESFWTRCYTSVSCWARVDCKKKISFLSLCMT